MITIDAAKADALKLTVSVSKRKLFEAFKNSGSWPVVKTSAQAATADIRTEWDYSTDIERTHPMVSHIQADLGWTDQQMDDVFKAAQ